MTNTELLEQLIEESGLKKSYLAARCHLSLAGFRNCVTNKAEFKSGHIKTLCKELKIKNLTLKEAVFFADNGA